ncbi:Fha domain-containing protein [Thalictrum thalictroides]|uniref:Fha domain-containing protein n=1 Tax=Thalictrum thalictroides TaxID=46969 RepID=A0A7J6VZ64_THATH|nr:Fha domain-containing protein [Thalictrum thalictroides]
MEISPMLKLIVEKGPREGETIERKPGSKIRIGRIVKGNNFTIKDAEISSKHLLIAFIDMKWVVYDLDTSNGTFLNEVQIEGNKGYGIKNGDFIRIGEFTEIRVCIDEKREIDDEAEGKKKEVGRKMRGRGDSSAVVEEKLAATASSSDEVVKEVKRKTQGRGRPKKQIQVSSLIIEAEAASVDVETGKEGDLESGVWQLKRNPRGRAVLKEQKVAESSLVSINNNQKICRKGKTELEKKDENVGSVVEGRGRGRGRRGMNTVSKDEVVENVSVGFSEMKMVGNIEVLTHSNYSKGEPSAMNVSSKNEGKMTRAKLEKMTLGEWFDYLEVYLPQKIDQETDKIIEGMINHGELYNKLMEEHHKLKAVPLLS